MPGVREQTPPLRRWHLWALVLFLLGFVGSLGWLLIDQLSKSYLDDVFFSARSQAEEVVKAIGGDESLHKAIETRKLSLQKINDALSRQKIVETIQVFDDSGREIYQTTHHLDGYTGGFPDAHAELLTPSNNEEVVESSREYSIQVPIEDKGTVVVRIPKSALTGRIGDLRHRLIVTASLAGGLWLVALIVAVVFISRLVKRNQQLESRRRLDEELAALGQLAANLAHEIRNPLNALSINLELLEEEVTARGGSAGTVVLARRESGRLSRLVNDFLTYARPAQPGFETFDAGLLIREVGTFLEPVCQRAGIELEINANPVAVRGDHGQLHQVLVNLAQNACQALEGAQHKKVSMASHLQNGRCVLEIADNGPGIPPKELARVKEAFYSQRKGGTGLGLAIADRIVEMHNGKLILSNREGGGLMARVILPVGKRKHGVDSPAEV